jgi:hypothetical protein
MNGQIVSLSLVCVVRDIARRSHLKAFLMSGDVNNSVKKHAERGVVRLHDTIHRFKSVYLEPCPPDCPLISPQPPLPSPAPRGRRVGPALPATTNIMCAVSMITLLNDVVDISTNVQSGRRVY